jgi:hypothetical protein
LINSVSLSLRSIWASWLDSVGFQLLEVGNGGGTQAGGHTGTHTGTWRQTL